jgi:hypothetical protein
VSVGCWETLGASVRGADGSSLGDTDTEGAADGSLLCDGAADGSSRGDTDTEGAADGLLLCDGAADGSELRLAPGAREGCAEGGSEASVGGALGVAGGELDGTAFSVTVGTDDGSELGTFNTDGTILMDGSWDGSVSAGCWETLGASVEGADGSSLGDTETEGAADGSLLCDGSADGSELRSAPGAREGCAEGGSEASIGGVLGVAGGELDGTALSVTVGTTNGTRVCSELGTFDADVGLLYGSWDGSVSVGCWKTLGAPVGGVL